MGQEACLPHSYPGRSLPSLAGRTHRWTDRKRRQELRSQNRSPPPAMIPPLPKEPERIQPSEKTDSVRPAIAGLQQQPHNCDGCLQQEETSCQVFWAKNRDWSGWNISDKIPTSCKVWANTRQPTEWRRNHTVSEEAWKKVRVCWGSPALRAWT